MRFVTWNVNSIRQRLPNVTRWLEAHQPDVVLLQEIKCMTEDFPALEFKALGYEPIIVGQKSYNGIAILSRGEATPTATRLDGDATDEQARYIEADINGVTVICVYVPNGNPVGTEKFTYKLAWMKRLHARVQTLLAQEKPFLIGGDFNVMPEAIDVYDPAGWENDALFHPETRRAWRELIHLGLTDAYRAQHPTKSHAYTFWDYQAGAWPRDHGLRIDHFLLSPEAADRLKACAIDRSPRGEDKASDHTPVLLEILD